VADELGAMKEQAPSPAVEPPAWRVLLAYARPYRLILVGGGC
jgi:hypothetical protein